ncbi:MAG: MATE family multidrug resistance protein [Candidatus Azotimanducaceae bacterium]
MGWLGAEALAAHQIALSIAAGTYMLASGIAAASTVRIGNQMGLKDYQTMKEVGYTSFNLSIIIMTIAGIGFILFNNWLPSLFIEDKAVVSMAADLLIIAALFQISDGIQSVGLGIQRGLEDTKTPTIITLTAYWVIALPLAYFLGFMLDMGIKGVWYGLAFGLSFAAIGLFTRFYLISNKIIKTQNNGST